MSMGNNDRHAGMAVQRVVSPVAIGTTGTGQTGKIIDRQGYGALEFVIDYGTISSTTAVYTVTIKEGDATGSLTSVADADLLGTELGAGLTSGTRTSGSTKNVSKRIGYKGTKRYVQANIKSTATAGTLVAITAILMSPNLQPISQ